MSGLYLNTCGVSLHTATEKPKFVEAFNMRVRLGLSITTLYKQKATRKLIFFCEERMAQFKPIHINVLDQ